MFPPPRGLIFGRSRNDRALPGVPPVAPRGHTMNLPRRQFLRLTGAVVAAPAVGLAACGGPETAEPRSDPRPTSPQPSLVEKLDIKGEEIQQNANAKGAIFGSNEDGPAGNQKRSLLWRIRGGGPGDIAWQLADVSVAVFQRPSPNIASLEITFRCTIWGTGYDSTTARSGGCYLEVVLLNKLGLVLNHLPLNFTGFDIFCQFKGHNQIRSLNYVPVDRTVFDDISHIQLFDRSGGSIERTPFIHAYPGCRG